jgi:hypothetical protein
MGHSRSSIEQISVKEGNSQAGFVVGLMPPYCIGGCTVRTPKGKKGVALAGFALTKPAMTMKATRTICRIVMTVLNALDSRVPRISSAMNSKHHPRANLVAYSRGRRGREKCTLAWRQAKHKGKERKVKRQPSETHAPVKLIVA